MRTAAFDDSTVDNDETLTGLSLGVRFIAYKFNRDCPMIADEWRFMEVEAPHMR